MIMTITDYTNQVDWTLFPPLVQAPGTQPELGWNSVIFYTLYPVPKTEDTLSYSTPNNFNNKYLN